MATETFNIPGMTEEELKNQFQKRMAQSRSHLSDWRDEARELYDMVAGRQWAATDEAELAEQGRPAVTFNLSGKFIDVVQGLQINNRQDIRFYPREPGDTKVNELLTGAADWARDLCSAADDETDAFYDAILTGLGWMEWYLDKDSDPVMPKGERRDVFEMYYDPRARKRGLSDARWVCRVKQMDADEYEEMFGKEDVGDTQIAIEADDEDSTLQIIPANQDYGSEGSKGAAQAPGKGRIPVADYQWVRLERFVRVQTVLDDGPAEKEFSEDEWATVEPMMQGRPYQAQKGEAKRYYRAIITPSGIKSAGPSPYQKGFTYHAITGKRDRNKNTWYGIGRVIADPQKFTNKFFSSILFQIMSNAKGGLLAEEGAFPDKRQAEDTWAKPDAITYVADGALANGRVTQKQQPPYPQGMDRLMQFTVDALPGVSGLNVELMGMTDRVQAGVVEAQRKQSAMAIIAWAFDSMRNYYRTAGRQIAAYIADYVPEGTLVRVLGEDGAKYVPLMKDKMTGTFDVVVDEAPTSVNMKERVWAVLSQIMPQLLTAGMPIPKEVLDYSPLPADLAQKWKQLLDGDPQKAEMAQKQMMESLRKLMAEAADKEASAGLKQAQTQKTLAETDTEKVNTIKTGAEAGRAMGVDA